MAGVTRSEAGPFAVMAAAQSSGMGGGVGGGGMGAPGAAKGGSHVASVANAGMISRVEGTLRSHGMAFPCVVDDGERDTAASSIFVRTEDGTVEWTLDVPHFAFTVLREALGGYGAQTVNHWIFDHITIQSARGDIQFYFGQRRMHKRQVSPLESTTNDDALRDVLRAVTAAPQTDTLGGGSGSDNALRRAVAKGFERVAAMSLRVEQVVAGLTALSSIPEAVQSVTDAARSLEERLEATEQKQTAKQEELESKLASVHQELEARVEELAKAAAERAEHVDTAAAAHKEELAAAAAAEATRVDSLVKDAQGAIQAVAEKVDAGFAAQDEARHGLEAALRQEVEKLAAAMPLTETAQAKEMAEMAREIQALKTTLEEERRQWAASQVSAASTAKRQLEALQAEREADKAEAFERIAELSKEIAEMKSKYTTVVLPQMQQQKQSERRTHVVEALSKLKHLESARSFRSTGSGAGAGAGAGGLARTPSHMSRSPSRFAMSPKGSFGPTSLLSRGPSMTASLLASPRNPPTSL